ncbi:MAG TPA: response regulator [Candidatus Bathyarchaeia archaeon]|nr:response regulator [Candidatus Bathyarchaeia archaeon]
MGERARILVVDDDEGIRTTLTAILEDEGYKVDTAESGKEAILKSNAGFYNLALIDVRLLDMQGTELLTRIKDTVPRMRKIIITGYPTVHNAIDAVNRNADAYMLKPFDIGKLLFVIKDQLRKQKDEIKFSQDRITEYIETRVKELNTSNGRNKSE